jgi:hypothetical protein
VVAVWAAQVFGVAVVSAVMLVAGMVVQLRCMAAVVVVQVVALLAGKVHRVL